MAELPVFTIRSDPSLGDIKSIDDVYKLKQGKEGPVDGSRCREHEYANLRHPQETAACPADDFASTR